MLKEQYEKVSNELLEKKVKLEDLKKKNIANASKIREHNAEINSKIILPIVVDDEIDRLNLELMTFYVHSSRISTSLTEKRKELSALKIDYDKKKLKADDETTSLQYKEKQLATMKTNLRDEEEKYEAARKKNGAITEQLQACYRQQLLLAETMGDETIKEKVATAMLNKFVS